MSDNPPAFPQPEWAFQGGDGREGMSLRDWFAGQMLCSLRRHHTGNEEWFAAEAYRQADAMLVARKSETTDV